MRFLIKLLSAVLIVLCSRANAQDFFPEQTDYAFRLNADYDQPGKTLSGDYKPGINYSLSFLKYAEKITYNFTVGYRSYNAKTPEVTETDATTGVVSQTSWSPYSTLGLYAGAAYNIDLTEKIRAYGGINAGLYFSSFSFAYRDDLTNSYNSFNQKQGYFAPKLGVTFALSNYVDLDVHGAYNIFTAGASYNSRTGSEGSINTSISAGAGLAFKF